MRTWGVEDLDFGLKCWLMGYRALVDPSAVIGHRFRKENTSYTVPSEHFYSNQLRMARKNFGETAWADWLDRSRRAAPEDLWEKTWSCFQETRTSAERERDYLMRLRPRDEYQYAAQFGLAWPLILPSSPLPPPSSSARPRLTKPQRPKPTIHTVTHEPPGSEPEPDDDDRKRKEKRPRKKQNKAGPGNRSSYFHDLPQEVS